MNTLLKDALDFIIDEIIGLFENIIKNVIENYLKLHSRNYKEIGQISPREEFKREKTSILTVRNRQIR